MPAARLASYASELGNRPPRWSETDWEQAKSSQAGFLLEDGRSQREICHCSLTRLVHAYNRTGRNAAAQANLINLRRSFVQFFPCNSNDPSLRPHRLPFAEISASKQTDSGAGFAVLCCFMLQAFQLMRHCHEHHPAGWVIKVS